LDKLFYILLLGVPWWIFWGALAAANKSAGMLLFFGVVPWLVWIVDLILDRFHTQGDLQKLMSRDDVVLATRAEYVGGHPQLPHGRFAYLTLSGDQDNPHLTIDFPGQDGADALFDIPLLDINKTDPKSASEVSMTGAILASLTERPGRMFAGERVTLNVDYQGPSGRKHKVELTSFFHGNDEIRNWRNYLVCAQAEADTGIQPFGPWKSLPAEPIPQEVSSHDGSGDGSKMQPARRAFERR
jgi:hypothetical protein